MVSEQRKAENRPTRIGAIHDVELKDADGRNGSQIRRLKRH